MATICHCLDGWICERQSDQPWLHDNCAGPGMPCDNPTCPFRIDRRPVKTRAGLVCPHCRQPVAIIENGTQPLIFQCSDCGSRWSADQTGTKVH